MVPGQPPREALAGTGGVDADALDADWFHRLDPQVRLRPGAAAPDGLRVPAPQAQRLLRGTIHLVADVPKGSSPRLVWVQGADELLVHLDRVELACDEGLVTVGVQVGCDQLPDDGRVTVPLAVGTAQLPTGLVMSTLSRPAGPAVVVDAWSEPIVAFAWEALVHLARTLCAAAGSDAGGRPLVPASIAAEPRVLLVQPAARHSFALRSADADRLDG